ncbi:MAG: hypothetical protein WCR87_09225 [Saccharofermentanales bacterium]|jgi:hypothetical protein
MKSEKRRKGLKYPEAQFDKSDELSVNSDRTRLSIPNKGIALNRLYCPVLKKVNSAEEDTVSINEMDLKRLW